MGKNLRSELRHVRELASGLEFDAGTYEMELFSDVPSAYTSAYWEYGILVARLGHMFAHASRLQSELPAAMPVVSLWTRLAACPDLIDPRLIWLASTRHLPELMSQIDNLLASSKM
jgi:hypothetical protein